MDDTKFSVLLTFIKQYPSMEEGLKPLLDEIATVAGYLWQKGWAERNAGNISLRITDMMYRNDNRIPQNKRTPLKQPFRELGGDVFLVSVTGSKMRHLAVEPQKNLVVIEMDREGSGFKSYGLHEHLQAINPTSELPTHLLLHQALKQRQRNERVVLHAHVTPVIAMTHYPSMQSEETINQVLWSMHPELHTYLPDGIGYVPMQLPGTEQIAWNTLKAFDKKSVAVWEKHGLFAVGPSPEEAFDAMDMVAKAAEIWLSIPHTG